MWCKVVDFFRLAPDRVHWRDRMETVMYLVFHNKQDISLLAERLLAFQ
jgi:hypothetical protein